MFLRTTTALALALTLPVFTGPAFADPQVAPVAATQAQPAPAKKDTVTPPATKTETPKAITPPYSADDIIGTLIAVEGKATITRDGAEKSETAAAAMPLHRKDKIETGPDGRVVAVLMDESELILGADAESVIDEYIYNPEAQTGGKARLSFLRGAFQYASGMIGKVQRPDIELAIPYGTIGMRGTRVWGGELDQYGVLVIEGKASVQTKRGTALLSAGEGVDLGSTNAAPVRRSKWEDEKVALAVATVTLTAQDEVTPRIQSEKDRLRTARGGEPDKKPEAAKPEEQKPAVQTKEPAAPLTPPALAPSDESRPRLNALEDAPEPPPLPQAE